MANTLIKVILPLIFLAGCPNIIADETEPQYYNNSYLNKTTASAFALQAGTIAGAARACGADVTGFINRVDEALNKITFGSADKVLASADFQNALALAQAHQANYPIPCELILRDFYSTPLMRGDYQASVLQSINPNSGQARPVPSQPNPEPAPSSIGDNAPPNINTLFPGGTPPQPNTPVDPNAPNILFKAPSIGPFVDTTKPLPNINDIAPDPWTKQNPPTRLSNPYSNPTPGLP